MISRSAPPGPTPMTRSTAVREVVTDDQARLPVRIDGDGPRTPLVLVNSLGTDLTMWDGVVPALAADRPVLRLDTRGHGGATVPTDPVGLDRLVADLDAVVAATGWGSVDLCGCSLGGLTALGAAVHRYPWLRRVVVANAAARVGEADGWEQRARTVEAGGMEAIADQVIERFLSPSFRARDPDRTASLRRVLVATDPRGYAACCRALADADLSGQLDRVEVPLLALAGTADVAVDPSVTTQLAHTVRGGAEAQLPGAGHLAPVEQPGAFVRAVRDHLDGATEPDLPAVGDPAPRFALPDQDGRTVDLDELRGRPVVLMFYPRDGGSGCTVQACAIRDRWPELDGRGAVVFGISADEVARHARFATEHDLPHRLLADPGRRAIEAYGAWGWRTHRDGTRVLGVRRHTVVVDEDGTIAAVLADVDPATHAAQVIAILDRLGER